MRYWLVRRPDGTPTTWLMPSDGPSLRLIRPLFGIGYVPLKAGPFTSYAEAEAARRRWEGPSRA